MKENIRKILVENKILKEASKRDGGVYFDTLNMNFGVTVFMPSIDKTPKVIVGQKEYNLKDDKYKNPIDLDNIKGVDVAKLEKDFRATLNQLESKLADELLKVANDFDSKVKSILSKYKLS